MCPFKEDCEQALLLHYVKNNGVSRNWCDKVAFAPKETIGKPDVVVSEEIKEKLLSGEVISLVITLNDQCFPELIKKQ